MMDSFDLDRAHSEGYVAGEAGASINHNPYPKDHFCHNAWIDGWDEADRDWHRTLDGRNTGGDLEAFLGIVCLLFLLLAVAKAGWIFFVWVFNL